MSHNPPLTNISLLPQSFLLPDSAAVHCHWTVFLYCLVHHSHSAVLVCKKCEKTSVMSNRFVSQISETMLQAAHSCCDEL